MRKTVSLAAFLIAAPALAAQTQLVTAPSPVLSSSEDAPKLPLHSHVLPLSKRIDGIFNGLNVTVPVAETIVYKREAGALSLDFDQIVLPKGCYLEVASLEDNDRQLITAASIDNGKVVSAFFNGEALRVRLFAAPGTKPSAHISAMSVEFRDDVGVLSICNRDSRVWNYHRAIGRMIVRKGSKNYICTGWLISTWKGTHATAGHCLSGASSVTVQYNVPRSSSSGARRNPPAADQYGWISWTRRFSNAGVGSDWGVFRTSSSPYARQRSYFNFWRPAKNNSVTRAGYGSDSGTANYAHQRDSGKLASVSWNKIEYRIDSTGGDSGGPVYRYYNGWRAVGIHTHGGCGWVFGRNKGTNVYHPSFQNAVRIIGR